MMSHDPIKISSIRPIKEKIMVRDMNFDERKLSSGIVIPTDDGKSSGVRPRWAQVFAVGPDQQDISVGQWICVAHGRWTRGTDIEINGEKVTVRMVDNNDILLVSDEQPVDDSFSSAV